MAHEDVVSPPYPGIGRSFDGLYATLAELRKWVLDCRADVNSEAGVEVVPNVRPLGTREAYLCQPVASLYGHLMFVRRVREEFDRLVREYEHDWNNPLRLRAQAVIALTAAVTLNDAFTPPELREARAVAAADKYQRAFDRLTAHLDELAEPEDTGDDEAP